MGTYTVTTAQIKEASRWINEFRQDWMLELPIRIHSRGVDDGHGLGSPPFHPEFERYLGQVCYCGRKPELNADGTKKNPKDFGCPPRSDKAERNPDHRLRTTRAFRKLRRHAPREFDALYLMCAHGESFYSTMAALNERAARLGKDDRYDEGKLMLLILSGLDKTLAWW